MEKRSDFFTVSAEIFTAMAHPSRLEILEILQGGERCVCHIQAVLDQRQAYISQHLNILRQAGLVTNRKEGKRVYYQVSDPQIFQILDALRAYLRAQNMDVHFPEEAFFVSPGQSCSCPQCTSSPM